MNEQEQIAAFEDDLTKLITRYRQEFELTVAATVGVLEVKKHELIVMAMRNDDDE